MSDLEKLVNGQAGPSKAGGSPSSTRAILDSNPLEEAGLERSSKDFGTDTMREETPMSALDDTVSRASLSGLGIY